MNRKKVILSSGAVLFGMGLVFVSLFTASQVSSNTGGDFTSKRFYFGQEVLPDHVAYPAIMAVDKVKLIATPTHTKPYRKIEYASRRLDYAQQLAQKGDYFRSLSTATKSQKYLISAAQDVLAGTDSDSPKARAAVATALRTNSQLIEQLNVSLPDDAHPVVQQLLNESTVLLQQLAQ